LDLKLLRENALQNTPRNNRLAIYAGANIAFLFMVGVAYALGGSPNPRILYLVLIFALCSTPIIYLDTLNGRYALLGCFLAAYFLMFGVSDVGALLRGVSTESSTSALSITEAVICVGVAALVLGYLSVVSLNGARAHARGLLARDWSLRSILIVGSVMWVIGTYSTYQWYVHIVTDTTNEAVRKGLESRGTLGISAFILGQMMQPFGILLLAYAWRRERSVVLLAPILAIVVLQVALGFVADAKGLAMLGGILVIVTIVLVDARIPKMWLLGAVVYAVIVFPVFQAYRTEIHGNRGIARTSVVENFGKVLGLALSAEERVNSGHARAQTLLERSSLRASVQLIVGKTGNEVGYQNGYTLTPLIATFIPKIIWPNKPDVPTGQLVNKQFHVTEGEDVYISPSHLGELYWNFGWPGVLIGMTCIGAILGFVGSRFNMADARTVTRLLVTVVTIKQVVMGFEGVIAASYVVWLRSLAGIGLLHWVFARMPARLRTQKARHGDDGARSSASSSGKAFPNLLT
jgi:hypothetical protein